MITINISLASNGSIRIAGYEQLVRFGYTKNRSVYRLAVTASGEWQGLAIRAFWHVPGGADPASSLVVDGYVDVPASVTAQPGNGCITFEGSDGTKTVTSADLRYQVASNSGTVDGTEPEPSSSVWQQFVSEVKDSAESAAASAEKAAQAAANANTSESNAQQSAATATDAAQKADKSAIESGNYADLSMSSAQEAKKQAELAAQAAEGKGFLYLEDDDNSGTLSLIVSDNVADDVTLQDNGHGILEAVYL